jgi:hypothetical protein
MSWQNRPLTAIRTGYISMPCTYPDGSRQACEIGDVCENNPTFRYQRPGSISTWTVQQYWSNWNNSCIHGDQPVSLKAFLRSIQFNFSNGLRSLNTPIINLQYIASREVAVSRKGSRGVKEAYVRLIGTVVGSGTNAARFNNDGQMP